MHRYENCICDLCQKPLTAEDEVVVCPECGAPMHRACYAKNGACAHAAEHAGGYEWHYPAGGAGAKVACAHCGAQNDPAARFCQICGAPMAAEGQPAPEGPAANGEWRRAYTYGNYKQPAEEFDVNGVSSEEMRTYLGKSADSLLLRFRIILSERFSPAAWNIPALLLGPFYFFYRRMKKIGLLLLLVLVAVYVPGWLYSTEVFKSTIAPQMFGITLPYSESLLRLLEPIAAVASWGRLFLHFYCGMRANRLLLTHVIGDIRSLHEQFPESERGGADYRRALSLRGAPSALSAIVIFLVFYGVMYAVTAMRLAPLLAEAGL